jgi:hypothetical protein
MPSSHRAHHAFHHNLTTIKPQIATTFPQKPLQKYIPTTSEKSRHNICIFASNHHGIAHPTAGEEASLLQSAYVLHRPRHNRRFNHAISSLSSQPKRHNSPEQHACHPAVIDKPANK